MNRTPRKDDLTMKRAICLLLCVLLLTGAVPAAAPDTPDTPAWLFADSGDSDTGDSGDSDTGDSGDSDTGDSGDSDTGDSGDSDTGNSSDTGDSGDSEEIIQLTPPMTVGWGRDYHFLMEFYKKQKSDEIKTDENGVEYVPCPGMMYWSVNDENQRRYRH